MRNVVFITPTFLSILDLTSIGGSEKRGDTTKIGQFCSGLKYAIAILARNNVKFEADVVIEGVRRNYSTASVVAKDSITGKEKELIVIVEEVIEVVEGEIEVELIEHATGISTDFGYDWELWQALREIYSNMIDEGGHFLEDSEERIESGTAITLSFMKDSPFAEVWDRRTTFFLDKEPIIEFPNDTKMYANDEDYLKIYKQGILVYKQENIKTEYSYSVNYGELDEKRVLRAPYAVATKVQEFMMTTEEKHIVDFILGREHNCQFLESVTPWNTPSYSLIEAANKLSDEDQMTKSFKFITKELKKCEGIRLEGRLIRGSSHFSSYTDVHTAEAVVEDKATIIEERVKEAKESPSDLKSRVQEKFNIEINVPLVETAISGVTSIYDTTNKCILVTKNIDLDDENTAHKLVLDIYTSNNPKERKIATLLIKELIKLIEK